MTGLLAVAAVLLVPQSAPVSPPVVAEPDVVVLGRRLKVMRLSAPFDRHGNFRCRVKRSSGDPATDALACEAVKACNGRSIRTTEAAQACVRERLTVRFGLQADGIGTWR